jgi:hypothetical protein
MPTRGAWREEREGKDGRELTALTKMSLMGTEEPSLLILHLGGAQAGRCGREAAMAGPRALPARHRVVHVCFFFHLVELEPVDADGDLPRVLPR